MMGETFWEVNESRNQQLIDFIISQFVSDYRERRLVADTSRDSPPPYTPPPPPPLSAAEKEVHNKSFFILTCLWPDWPTVFFNKPDWPPVFFNKSYTPHWGMICLRTTPQKGIIYIYSPGEGRHWGWAWMSNLPWTLKTSDISGRIITNFAKKVKVEFKMDGIGVSFSVLKAT